MDLDEFAKPFHMLLICGHLLFVLWRFFQECLYFWAGKALGEETQTRKTFQFPRNTNLVL